MYNVLAFMAGIFLNDNVLGVVLITILFILCEIWGCLTKYVENKKVIQIQSAFLIISFISGNLFFNQFNYHRLNEIADFDGNVVELTGTVCSDGEEKGSYWQYILKNNMINGKKISSRILLKSKYNLEYGNKIKVTADLECPSGARNKGTFDYSDYLKTLDVFIVAESRDTSILREKALSIPEEISYSIRKKVREFTALVLEEKEASILDALVIGDDSTINNDLKDDYKKAGMIHLLVVSGGHTAFLLILLKQIFSLFGFNKNILKVLYICSMIMYIVITGATPSVLRAGIGIIIIILSELIGRQNDGFTTISIVAFILLINNPNVLYSLSFLLSFAGTIGIMLCFPKLSDKLEKIPEKIREPLALTLSAQLFVTPITIYSFNVVYLGGLFSNLFAMNLAGIIMMSGIILFVLYLFFGQLVILPMKLLAILIKTMNKIAEFLGDIEWLAFYLKTPTWISIFLYYLILIYIFAKKTDGNKKKGLVVLKFPKIPSFLRRNFRYIIIICGIVSIFIFNASFIANDNSLKIAVIDVGHGDSILITTPGGYNILMDTGDKYYRGESVTDTGSQTIVPYLLKNGIDKIDLLILSHMDSDHIGGYESIAKSIKIDTLGLSVNSTQKPEYENIKNIAENEKINIKSLKRGDSFQIDEVAFKVLMPLKTDKVEEENNDSIVLLLEYQNKKALFMGDLEAEGEEILMQLEKDLQVDVLKLGHHGSKTSTSEKFVKATYPKIALISVGNRFKSIPGKEVLERLNSIYSKIYRTDKNGEIDVIIKNGVINVNTTY